MYVYLAVVGFVTVYIATVGFKMAGEHITQRIREDYLAAVLRQNMAYFEGLGVGEVNTRITADINLIQDAITMKASISLSAIATFISALIISFVTSWRLALVLLPTQVLIVGSMSLGASFMIKYTVRGIDVYSQGASIAQEAISSIETVAAFGMQNVLARKYGKQIGTARSWGIKSGIALAVMLGVMNGVIFWSYGLAFWQGSRFLVHDQISLSAILTILFANLSGAFALGNVSPHTGALVNGLTATGKISRTISRVSPIDPSNSIEKTLSAVRGFIEFRNVRHAYPSRPDALILDDVNIQFPEGKMTAIVGTSGCGKSTIVSLIERFYQPASGQICE